MQNLQKETSKFCRHCILPVVSTRLPTYLLYNTFLSPAFFLSRRRRRRLGKRYRIFGHHYHSPIHNVRV